MRGAADRPPGDLSSAPSAARRAEAVDRAAQQDARIALLHTRCLAVGEARAVDAIDGQKMVLEPLQPGLGEPLQFPPRTLWFPGSS